jgi:uncharacterized protein (TIGR03437 family)
MQMSKRLLVSLVVVAGSLAAQTPTISGIVNGASGIPAGAPHYAIAKGSIFVIYGTHLGAAPPAGAIANSARLPLSKTGSFAGTSVTVNVNGTTLPAPILYTLPTQVSAIMPSGIPTGTGTVTVSYGGKSGSGPVKVLVSDFGVSNVRSPTGFETAAVTFGTNERELVTVADSAAPGDILVLFGTGLGPSIGDIDTTFPLQGNLGTAPLVYVGGVLSPNVPYYGRTPIFPGLDEIIFEVPQGVPMGCHVSIIVQTANLGVPIVSNAPDTAISANDHTPCTDPVEAFPPNLLARPGNTSVLNISLTENQSFVPSAPGAAVPAAPVITDTYQVLAAKFTPIELFDLQFVLVEATQGNCLPGFVPTNGPPLGLPPATYLDAGTSVTLTPPSGAPFMLPAVGPGVYLGKDSAGFPAGTWGFSTPGGANVGALNFQFPIAQPVTWTNRASVMASPIDRTKGLTITWSGGDNVNGFVDIQSFAANTTGTFLFGYDCSAPISAGSFTIPPSVLLRMPPGPSAGATFQVSTFTYPFKTPAVKGFDSVANLSHIETVVPIVYQ